jgi:hypothetical protein
VGALMLTPTIPTQFSSANNGDSNNHAFNIDSNNMENLMAKLCTLQGKDIKISR